MIKKNHLHWIIALAMISIRPIFYKKKFTQKVAATDCKRLLTLQSSWMKAFQISTLNISVFNMHRGVQYVTNQQQMKRQNAQWQRSSIQCLSLLGFPTVFPGTCKLLAKLHRENFNLDFGVKYNPVISTTQKNIIAGRPFKAFSH